MFTTRPAPAFSLRPILTAKLKSPYPMDRTLDHLIADKVSHRTPIRSLELNCNSFKDLKESIYLDNISWYGPEHVATAMKDPSQVYQRLFKTRNSDKDITDLILEDAANFKKNLTHQDKDKLDEYFESVREIEIADRKAEQILQQQQESGNGRTR